MSSGNNCCKTSTMKRSITITSKGNCTKCPYSFGQINPLLILKGGNVFNPTTKL